VGLKETGDILAKEKAKVVLIIECAGRDKTVQLDRVVYGVQDNILLLHGVEAKKKFELTTAGVFESSCIMFIMCVVVWSVVDLAVNFFGG